jgi:CheY-like chemotaxis protein
MLLFARHVKVMRRFNAAPSCSRLSLIRLAAERIPDLRVVYVGWIGWEAGALEDLLIILVVDDDPMVQGIVESALTDGGFEPVIAQSGEEAVTLLKEAKSKYRALVTDIDLGQGKMDGWEVARHAREIDPAFPIIYMTAASADQWPANGVPDSILVTKPFAPAQLVTAVSQLLNTAKPTT